MPAITTIRLRRGTAAQWTSANPVLSAGEIGLETDTRRTKYGNGSQTWSALPYSVADTSGIATVDWSAITGKPADFPPSAHTHVIADVTDVTASAAELNVLDGLTASTAELNVLDGLTASTAELNYVDGVTSAIQTQIDGKAASVHTHVMTDITDLAFPPSTVLSDTAPVSPAAGTRWIKTTTMQEYVYFDSFWVEI